jgi:hypothetical protein
MTLAVISDNVIAQTIAEEQNGGEADRAFDPIGEWAPPWAYSPLHGEFSVTTSG